MNGSLKSRPPGIQFIIFICITIGCFLIAGMIGTFILSAITGVDIKTMADADKWDSNTPSVVSLIRGMQIVQFVALFVLPVYICSRLFSTDAQRYLGFREPSNNMYFLAAIAAMIVAIPLTEYLGLVNKNIHLPASWEKWVANGEEKASKTISIILSRHTIKDLVLNIICIAGLAAVGEELLFRGMVQRLLTRMFRNHWGGIIITAALFSAIHMQFYGFIPRFVLGMLLGIIYWYSGSLWVAIAAHFVYDALLIIVAYQRPDMMNDEMPQVNMQNFALVAALSFAAVAGAVVWMKKKSTTRYADVYADDDVPVKNHPFDI